MDKKVEISSRLKEFVDKKFEGNVAEFARNMGMKRRQDAYPYINGESLLGSEKLSVLIDLGCDINWLLTGKQTNEYVVKEPQSGYGTLNLQCKKTKIEFIELLIERNNLTPKDFADAVNISETILGEILTSRHLSPEIFTAIINGVEKNKDKFIDLLGINFEVLKHSTADHVPVNIDSPIQTANQNSDEGGVQIANLNKSSLGDINEHNHAVKGVESKIVNKLIANYDSQIKFLQESVTFLRGQIKQKDSRLEEQQKLIDELKTKMGAK